MIMSLPSQFYEALLPSITSTEFRRIVILATEQCGPRTFFLRMASMDEQLCKVVDRLRAMGYHHTLEVELRFAEVECLPGKNDFTKVFPWFRERGVVTVINDTCGDLVHRSSAHSR